ncbi:hypothetical protein HK103_006516 [Boothiomyces macroporosus]|uniref:Malic enzyme n=1 Tax=Boothiomyces macroporosus TaxID=261099 RepID=A0AAD5UM51_9FUNG|nr:hypothetical protein HK103_006516 [Boothiomyces macroporosus]
MKAMTPLVYTPVVGEACQKWSDIYRQPEGMYLPVTELGNLDSIIAQFEGDPQICVVTDGGRILGLGDLGVGGLGISIGKLDLYTACAGISHHHTLPIVIDFGTNNQDLLNNPLYLGLRQNRVDVETQARFMDEFMECITRRFPKIIVQFEDFATDNAFKWLGRYQKKYACFNDDIQGTGAVVLSGIQKALELAKIKPEECRVVFMGAGSAGVGVARMISEWIEHHSDLTEEEAKKLIYLVDSKGLVCNSRGDKLADHKKYFARNDIDFCSTNNSTLMGVLEHVKPNILIGLCTVKDAFVPDILKYMAEINERPIIMPLSNPVGKSECTFEQAMVHTNNKVIFASGSPFPSYSADGVEMVPGQGNNMYIFPGLGLGCILSQTTRVTNNMVFAASKALADCVTEEETSKGMIYPEIDRIRECSLEIAVAVIKTAVQEGVGKMPETTDLRAWVESKMYDPFYSKL